MSYKPIEQYGIIGDLHTAALVGIDGSIDWCCLPHFDSPSVFASLLDHKKGGHFKICSVSGGVQRQLYFPESNVLITRCSNPTGVAEVVDFMPMESLPDSRISLYPSTIVRYVRVMRGSMELRLGCFPAFNYARDSHRVVPVPGGVIFQSEKGQRLGLSLPNQYSVQKKGVVSQFTLSEGQSIAFVLRWMGSEDKELVALNEQEGIDLYRRTADYWRRWLSRCTYQGRWREVIYRSLLALKLLTFQPTGAIVAAPTCSLPEQIGGVRNWDYRFTWLRDAAFTLYAFMRVGLTEEAEKFMGWLDNRAHELTEGGTLQIMYGIDGRSQLTEETLDHLEGYKGSRPVRIGNAAHQQLQLDIYGELMDAVYLYNKYGSPISYDLWQHLREMLNCYWCNRRRRRRANSTPSRSDSVENFLNRANWPVPKPPGSGAARR
ncbi:MAG: glycoside hydrolase family 15 protein, partial [Dehalococcoidia bacterium]